MTHADNLTRVQVLRGPDTPMQTVFYPWVAAVADHLEDVFTRHAPYLDEPERGCRCQIAGRMNRMMFDLRWPCPDYASALRLLDALDGGAS